MKHFFLPLMMCLVVVSCQTQSENNTIQAVDLGLPSGTKWADRNLGAESPTVNGGYYAWGEIAEKDAYSWDTYQHCESIGHLTKYNNNEEYGESDGKLVLDSEDDAAYKTLGEGWRIPTVEECDELMQYCEWIWNVQEGFIGFQVVGPNGNSIFLPAAAYLCEEEGFEIEDFCGMYWLSHADPSWLTNAFVLTFSSEGPESSELNRSFGASIRPVAQ